MNVLALTCFLILQVAAVLSAGDKRLSLGDLITRISDKKIYKGEFIEECHQEPIELGLVVDSSVSIQDDDFLMGQKFLSDFLRDYDIGQGRNQVRVAVVTFGRGVYVKDGFNLTTYSRKEDVLHHVTHMNFRAGSRTDTGDAIRYMRDVQMRDTRPWAPKFVIVVTDGNSQRWMWTRLQARRAIAANITMFALGIGPKVSRRELLNLVGGDPSRVIRARSYDNLDGDLKDTLAKKTCFLVPKPTTTTTTTTTTPMAAQPCKELYPSDINFIFSPAALGVETTSWVTQFISHTVTNQELDSGFQYGAVTGDCPDDEGFELKRYSDAQSIRDHLVRYDRNNLPQLVQSAARRAFTANSGGRQNATKIAVIFIGNGKVDLKDLSEAIEELQATGARVFVSRADPGVSLTALPPGVRVLTPGSSLSQALELVSLVCHHELLPEGAERLSNFVE
ncbi:collagen alpha-5(VI) chain-like [Babylonia areolata]|uniref:collagen alpha-5(VI) chain-like n=1 Tax=Babylonia areolata TaxID=304850 RepID=UPI003FD0BFD4